MGTTAAVFESELRRKVKDAIPVGTERCAPGAADRDWVVHCV
jgi:hypothetical protein